MRLFCLHLGIVLISCTAAIGADYPQASGSVIASQSWGTLWQSSAMNKITPSTPVPSGTAKSVSISTARNEYEPIQLILRPAKALTGVQVSPRTLIGPKGAKLPAWNIEVRRVEFVKTIEPSSPDVQPGTYPDPLPPFSTFNAPAGVNSPIWLTVYVPDGTPAGDYKGVVDITASGSIKISVPVSLHVWNFTLPWVSKLKTAFGNDMTGPADYQNAVTIDEKRKLIDLYNKEFRKHRVSPSAPYTFYDIKASMVGVMLNLDFVDFDIAIKKYFSDFNTFRLPGFSMGDSMGLDLGDNYDRIKIEAMRSVAEHLIDKGQLEKGYNYVTDDPTPDKYNAIKDAADLCQKADGRIKVMQLTSYEPKLAGFIQIWSPRLDAYDSATAKTRQAKGEEFWWYANANPQHPYPNNFIDYPAIDQRIIPWLAWQSGVEGIFYQSATTWAQNPWEIAMTTSADGTTTLGNGTNRLLYPPVKTESASFVDKAPVPSIRWEMIREGIEDYDYLVILKDRIAIAKNANPSHPAIAKAEEALAAASKCAQSSTDFTRDPAELMAARTKVALAIEGLK